MSSSPSYTTQLQAGLGLVTETRTLLELWRPGMSVPQVIQTALESGQFPNVTARRLRNIVAECFAPRYLAHQAQPAKHLKALVGNWSETALVQLMLLFTCRANPILADFIRNVYWEKYAAGHQKVSSEDARVFIERAMDDGKTVKRWSDSTTRRVAGYLTACCADYGLLEKTPKSERRMVPFHLQSQVAAYLAYDLHFSTLGDNALLAHPDWQLFGLQREDVREELKRLSLQGLLIYQAAGDVVQIGWKHSSMEAVCEFIA